MGSLRKQKHTILLTALIGVILVQSFSHRLLLGPLASDLAISTAQLLVFFVVFDRPTHRMVAFVALTIALAADWVQYVLPRGYPEDSVRVIYHSALLLLTGFATIVILRNIFEQRIVRADDVLGAVCGYLLAGGAWSNLFMLVEVFVPGSFSVGPGFFTHLDTWFGRMAALNYVSLGSLTGVGAGQVVPIRPPATMLMTLEAVFGQFYIAVVVAQIVGAKLAQGFQRHPSDETPVD